LFLSRQVFQNQDIGETSYDSRRLCELDVMAIKRMCPSCNASWAHTINHHYDL
jgi:hypothetical protein